MPNFTARQIEIETCRFLHLAGEGPGLQHQPSDSTGHHIPWSDGPTKSARLAHAWGGGGPTSSAHGVAASRRAVWVRVPLKASLRHASFGNKFVQIGQHREP